MSATILVVDDDALVNDFIVTTLREGAYNVENVFSAEAALDRIGARDYDLVISDVKMPGMDGLSLLERLQTVAPDTAVVIMTGYGGVPDAVRAMKAGAFEYLVKPVGAEATEAVVARALEFRRLKLENRMLRDVVARRVTAEMIGASASMQKVIDRVESVASSRANVLITGESGTGKELVARALHFRGNRRGGPFKAINCAALPETLFESELFGHEKGAFTGALRQKRGLFELCDGGTLLLDEISEMTTALQAKLLRVVQEREIQRLGSDRALAVDVRVVATTNRHLPTEVTNGSFREDLYFRLNVVEINLPPLRERADDIPLLVEHFVQRFNRENGRSVKRINDAAMKLLVTYHWPGNVRELENYLERAIVTASGEVLTPDDFPAELATGGPKPRNAPVGVGSTIHDMEKWLILTTLEAEANNQTRAADRLGISSRTLRNKLYEYGVKTPGGNGGSDRPDGKPSA